MTSILSLQKLIHFWLYDFVVSPETLNQFFFLRKSTKLTLSNGNKKRVLVSQKKHKNLFLFCKQTVSGQPRPRYEQKNIFARNFLSEKVSLCIIKIL